MDQSWDRRLAVFYDLNWMPISFDFATFLMDAELARAQSGLSDMHVFIVPGKHDGGRLVDAGYDKAVDRHSRQWRLYNILLPMLSFYPTVSGFEVVADRLEALDLVYRLPHVYPEKQEYGKRDVAAIFRSLNANLAEETGAVRPRALAQDAFHVRQWLLAHCGQARPVAISLRTALHSPQRNSNIDALGAFAASLDKQVYSPFFIPDTDTALDPPPAGLKAFPFFSAAALDLGLRVAATEIAYLNILTSGGPSTICSYMASTKYLYFKHIVAGAPEASEAHLTSFGHVPGRNVPFATPFQKWVWEDDDQDIVAREFHAMARRIEDGY